MKGKEENKKQPWHFTKGNYHQSCWILCQGGLELIPVSWGQWHRIFYQLYEQECWRWKILLTLMGATVSNVMHVHWLSLCPWEANKLLQDKTHYMSLEPSSYLSSEHVKLQCTPSASGNRTRTRVCFASFAKHGNKHTKFYLCWWCLPRIFHRHDHS